MVFILCVNVLSSLHVHDKLPFMGVTKKIGYDQVLVHCP